MPRFTHAAVNAAAGDATRVRGQLDDITASPFKDTTVDTEIHRKLAMHLKIDPNTEEHLLWICKLWMDAPGKKGWRIEGDSPRNFVFVDEKTGISTQHHPWDEFFKNLLERTRNATQSLSNSQQSQPSQSQNSQQQQQQQSVSDDFDPRKSGSKQLTVDLGQTDVGEEVQKRKKSMLVEGEKVEVLTSRCRELEQMLLEHGVLSPHTMVRSTSNSSVEESPVREKLLEKEILRLKKSLHSSQKETSALQNLVMYLHQQSAAASPVLLPSSSSGGAERRLTFQMDEDTLDLSSPANQQQQQYSRVEVELETAQERIRAADVKIAKLQKLRKMQDATIQSLQSLLANVEERCMQLEQQQQNVEEKSVGCYLSDEQYHDEKKSWELKAEEMQQVINGLEEKLQVTTQDIDAKNERIKKLETKVSTLQAEKNVFLLHMVHNKRK